MVFKTLVITAAALHSGKTHKLALPMKLDSPRLAVAVFRHNAFAAVFIVAGRVVGIVVIRAVQEQNDIRVLLDRSGISQVGKHRSVLRTLLAGTGQLVQGDYRHVDRKAA